MLTVTFEDPMDHYTTIVMADRFEIFPGQGALLVMSKAFLLRFLFLSMSHALSLSKIYSLGFLSS
jgi:hypothetical protein